MYAYSALCGLRPFDVDVDQEAARLALVRRNAMPQTTDYQV